jgi:TatD DNase family protein
VIIIDTHSHLYLDAFDGDRALAVQRARDAGVERMLLPNVDISTIGVLKEACRLWPGYCLPMMGLHPCSVKDDYKDQLRLIRSELELPGYIAVGEIGIDLYWDKTHFEEQKQAFDLQLQWAEEFSLPAVIHMRESFREIMEVIRLRPRPNLKAVFHCFTGTSEQAAEITGLGYYLGIGGVLTYKNSGLPELLRNINQSLIVLETDAPYLPPVPHRGKRNESAYLVHLLPLLADAWAVEEEEVAAISTRNASRLFNL